MNAFWSIDDLDLDDPLNGDIWSDSPREQDRIQPYTDDWKVGAVGAQQAMRHPYRLPWVPDPVGLDWRSRDALFIFGSAYGPFIGGSSRPHELSPADYACNSSGEFLRHFLKRVLISRPYYARIAEIASSVVRSCRLLATVDLCRVAFVRRDDRRDTGGDKIARSAPRLFSEFVESTQATDWLWRRVAGSQASALVALGTVAEHGVLRLFARHLQNARIRDSQDATIQFSAMSDNFRWPLRYAHNRRHLRDREHSTPPPYWEIDGELGGNSRRWRLAVVPHPTGAWARKGAYSEIAAKTVYVQNEPA